MKKPRVFSSPLLFLFPKQENEKVSYIIISREASLLILSLSLFIASWSFDGWKYSGNRRCWLHRKSHGSSASSRRLQHRCHRQPRQFLSRFDPTRQGTRRRSWTKSHLPPGLAIFCLCSSFGSLHSEN